MTTDGDSVPCTGTSVGGAFGNWYRSGNELRVRDATLAFKSIGLGPTMLVLHGGLGIDSSYLHDALSPLATELRVVFYDQRGHGCSTGRQSLATAERDILVEDAEAMRTTLAERVLLFGHSYGGFVALEYALRYPDRVTGLVLCATSASVAHVSGALAAVSTRARSLELEALHAILTSPPSSDSEFSDLWRAIAPLYFKDQAVGRASAFDGTRYSAAGYAAGARWLADYDVRSRLDEIEVPVLLLHGTHDWLMPADVAGSELAAALKRPTRVTFHDSGHYPFLEQPDAFVDSIRSWLRSFEITAL
jgi:proline iminopeptidase